MASGPEVSVIVPCHAAARTVGALLDALERQTLDPKRFEVLLVDPRADGTGAVIERRLERWTGAEVKVVPSPLSGGPAVKRNLGAKRARGRLFAFTDSDCLPEPGWLAAGLAAFESGFEVIQGSVLPPDGEVPSRLAHYVFIHTDHGLFETANIFYSRALLESLGGFPEHWFRRYAFPFGEDAEVGWRALRSGAAFRFEPEAVVRHPVGAPSLRGHLREQWLARGFPELVRQFPEVRDKLMVHHVFLNRDSMKFAAAAVGVVAARRHRLALALTLPYAGSLLSEGRGWGRHRHRAIAAKLLSDGVLFAALAVGSARARSLVL